MNIKKVIDFFYKCVFYIAMALAFHKVYDEEIFDGLKVMYLYCRYKKWERKRYSMSFCLRVYAFSCQIFLHKVRIEYNSVIIVCLVCLTFHSRYNIMLAIIWVVCEFNNTL